MSRENSYMPRPWIRPNCYVGQTWEGWLIFLGRDDDRVQEILRSWA